MKTLRSADGTTIAFDRSGSGQPIIFVPGAMNDHTRCEPLAAALATDHTAVTYDRRARGESGDTKPYTVDREVEDLAAVIDEVGGQAVVFGYSSGGILALKAAAEGVKISHLVIFEAPFALGGMPPTRADLPGKLAELVARDEPGDAIALFQSDVIGLPAAVTAQARQSPMWPALEAMAQSVVYDTTLTAQLGAPTPGMAAVDVPTLVATGAETWPALRASAEALAALLPHGRFEAIEGGADHDIPVAATASAIRAFVRG